MDGKPGAAHLLYLFERDHTTVIDQPESITASSQKRELLQLVEESYSSQVKTTVLYHDKPSKKRPASDNEAGESDWRINQE
jgi:glutathione synthase/RimK-type ligase-like ATP-grasp enzyme